MIDTVRAELVKLRIGTGLYSCLVLNVVIVGLSTIGTMKTYTDQLQYRDDYAYGYQGGYYTPDIAHQMKGLIAVSAIAVLVATAVGILSVTSEYHAKTITQSLLATPRRPYFLAAKAAAVTIISIAFSIVWLALTSGIIAIWPHLGAHDRSAVLGVVVGMFARVVLAYVLFGLVGIAIGALVRNTAVAILIPVLLLLLADPILSATWPKVGRFLPYNTLVSLVAGSGELVNGFQNGAFSVFLSPGASFAVIVAYIVVIGAGGYAMLRTDVT